MDPQYRQVLNTTERPKHRLLRRSFYKYRAKLGRVSPSSVTSEVSDLSPLSLAPETHSKLGSFKQSEKQFSPETCTSPSSDAFEEKNDIVNEDVATYRGATRCRSQKDMSNWSKNCSLETSQECEHLDMYDSKPMDDNTLTLERGSLMRCISEEDIHEIPHEVSTISGQNYVTEMLESYTQDSGTIGNGVSPLSGQSFRINPIIKLEKDLECFRGADSEFLCQSDPVLSKLFSAKSEPQSSYLFRDFAGHFVTSLDRFGPGGYDFHRAPVGFSWVSNSIKPWTYIEDDVNDNQVSVYDEVNCWIRNLCCYLGRLNDKVIFAEGVWDTCVEHMAMSNPCICEIAYRTAKVILTSYEIDQDIIYKVLMMRNATFGYDEAHMSDFRICHIKLMDTLLIQIGENEQRLIFKDLVLSINHELENLFICETNPVVSQEITKTSNRAEEVYKSITSTNQKKTSRFCEGEGHLLRPRSSFNFLYWYLSNSSKTDEVGSDKKSEGKPSISSRRQRWNQIKRRFNSMFKGSVREENENPSPPDMHLLPSINTVDSYELYSGQQQFFGNPGELTL